MSSSFVVASPGYPQEDGHGPTISISAVTWAEPYPEHSHIYRKPWQSRRLITGFVGCGMPAPEENVCKRQRCIVTRAFTVQNMCELVTLVFTKGDELKERWSEMTREVGAGTEKGKKSGMKFNVCHWVSRATFGVIGLVGKYLLDVH